MEGGILLLHKNHEAAVCTTLGPMCAQLQNDRHWNACCCIQTCLSRKGLSFIKQMPAATFVGGIAHGSIAPHVHAFGSSAHPHLRCSSTAKGLTMYLMHVSCSRACTHRLLSHPASSQEVVCTLQHIAYALHRKSR